MPYRDDLDAAHAQLRALKNKIKDLTRKKNPEEKVKCKECSKRVINWADIGWTLIALILVLAMLVGMGHVFSACGDRGGCYVHSFSSSASDNKFRLSQTIEWDNDERIGYFVTLDEAIEAANKLQCPIGHDAVPR